MRFSALVLWLPLAWANPPSWYAIVQPRLFQHSVRAPQRTALSQSSYPDDPQFPQAERCVAASASSGLALSRVPALGGGLATAAICVVAMIVTIQTIQPGAVPASMESTRRLLQEWASIRALNPQTAAFLAAFGMYAASDAMGQCVTAWRQADKDGDVTRLDVKRMLRSAACSGLLSGWFAVIYFGILDHFVRLPAWAAEIDGHLGAFLACLPVIVKVAVDVGLYEPLYDTVYMSLQALLQNQRPNLRSTLPKVLSVWSKAPFYWGIADTVNFAFVSTRLRPLYNAVASIPWSMYLSQTANV